MYLTISTLLTLAYLPVYHFWQPLFAHLAQHASFIHFLQEHKVVWLGIIFFCSNSTIYVVNLVVRKYIIERYNPFKIAIIATIKATLFLIVIGLPSSKTWWVTLLAFCLLHATLAIASTIAEDQYCRVSPQKSLASLLSFTGTIQRLASIIILSFIANNITLEKVDKLFMLCSIFTFISVLVFSSWNRIYKQHI